jgi:predicted HTH domain antitoxin
MLSVNVDELENHPAAVLRRAKEEDLVVLLNRDHPEAVLVSLEKLGLPDPDAVRVALAVSLFRNEAITAGFAARMADKPLPDMLALLSSLGIPLTGNTPEAHDDMRTARQWLDLTPPQIPSPSGRGLG